MEIASIPPPMDDRIRKRRRSVRWERSRGRRTALLLVGLVVCATVAFLWLRSTDVFAVRHVVATGTDQITKEQLASITSTTMGRSLLSLSTEGVEEALLALPYVDSVNVIRSFPNTLEIKVVEYLPVARLQTEGGATWLVSDSGKVIEDTDPSLLAELPVLVPDALPAMTSGEILPGNVTGVLPLVERLGAGDWRDELPPIANIAVSAAGCASLVLEDGGEVRLGGPDGVEQKLEVAVDIVKKCVAQGRLIEYVDASVLNRVAVKAK